MRLLQKTGFFLWAVSFVFVSSVSGTWANPEGPGGLMQEVPEGLSETPPKQVVVVADVNVTDVNVTEADGKLTGTFALQGGMGLQQRIAYGIMATNAERDLLDVVTLGRGESVAEGEIKTLPIEYQFPSSLQGNVVFVLWAETEAGLLLGTQVIAQKTLDAKPRSLTCATEETRMALTCTSTVGGSHTVFVYRGSLFTEPVSREEIVLSAGTAFRIAPNVPAGRYKVLVQDTATRELVRQDIVIAGTYGSIINAVAHRAEADKVTLTVSVAADSVQDLTLEYVLSGTDGQSCGTGTAAVSGPVVMAEVATPCDEGELAVQLKKGSAVLATLTEPFRAVFIERPAPVEAQMLVTPVMEEKKSSFVGWLLALLVVIPLLVLMVGVVRARGKRQNTIAMFLGLVFMGGAWLGSAQPADAASVYSGGEIGFMSATTLSTNKSSYTPNEAITLTSTTNISNDSPNVYYHWLAFSVGIPWDYGSSKPRYNYTFGMESMPAFNYVSTQYTGPFSVTDSTVVTGPATVGLHSLQLRPVLEGANCSSCPQYGWDYDRISISFTVANPAPVIDLRFGN